MNSIVLTEAQWSTILGHLAGRSDERMAFGYAGISSVDDRNEYLVQEIDLPADSEYRHQGRFGVTLKVEHVLARVVKAKDCAAFLDVHSHPFTTHPRPSGTDEAGAVTQRRVLRDLAPGVRLIRLVFGIGSAVWAEVADENGQGWHRIDRIIVLGPKRRTLVLPVNSAPTLSGQIASHDRRTAVVLGNEAVALIRSINVLVVGAGGTGSAVIAQLRGYVNHVDIVDPDIVEPHNAPRLYHYIAGDEGNAKVDMHRREIDRAFPACRVRALRTAFPDGESTEFFKQADVVFCCPDHNAVRYAAAAAAARYMKPLIEIGCGGKQADGRIVALGYHVRLQVPGSTCLACNGLDLSELEDPASSATKRRISYVTGGDLIAGELMPLTTRAAADAVDIFFRYVTGYAPCACHLYFDALRLQTIDLSESYASMPNCTLCGSRAPRLAGTGDRLGPEHQILRPVDIVASSCTAAGFGPEGTIRT